MLILALCILMLILHEHKLSRLQTVEDESSC